jgi:hypothetical protein
VPVYFAASFSAKRTGKSEPFSNFNIGLNFFGCVFLNLLLFMVFIPYYGFFLFGILCKMLGEV